eukprot:TRINITY_DN3270_c0_g1_i1.p2 TRINITY_DN3270_c0_g1~~TRINITY_DN3270_c0_g1_i1.p2  ORF type:complete len:285 (-),score=64.29 TRINITY_DN3270_c0_g1_i1:2517-3371(-)
MDEEEWADTYATDNNLDKNRVNTVIKMGIYAGDRDEFNQRTGEGKAIFANGDMYEGQYWEGKKNGKGKYIFKSLGMSEVDKLISEQWKAREAQPEDQQADVDEFIQKSSQQFAVGPECVRFAIQENTFYPCYNGEYVNNMRHGRGIMKNKDGSVYSGSWKHNKRQGEGIYYYVNGDIYSGQWVDGLKHGNGRYTYTGKKGEYVGSWENGLCVEGQWRMTEVYYEGKFEKNKPCDENGEIKFPVLGLQQTGEYKKNKWRPGNDLNLIQEFDPDAEEQQQEGAETQ